MLRKTLLTGAAATLAILSQAASAAYTKGGYVFPDSNAFISEVTYASAWMFDGSNWVDPTTSPNLTDINDATYLSTGDYAGYRDVTLGLRFGTTVVDGPGADIALFFVGDPAGAEIFAMSWATEAITPLSLTPVVDDAVCGGACYVQNGGVNVPLMVAEIDIGLDLFMTELTEFDLRLVQAVGTAELPSDPVAFSLGGAMHVAPVPVPAAVWLFGSGLLGLVGVARRRRA